MTGIVITLSSAIVVSVVAPGMGGPLTVRDGPGYQLLDRVVATVGGAAITESDVLAALTLGIVDPEPGEERMASATRQLIDRRLMLAEVNRFPPSEPTESAIAGELARMKTRAGAAYADIARRTGLQDARLRALARDTLRLQAYIAQRFGTTSQVGAQDARAYYDAHPKEFSRDGAVLPFEQVEAAARALAADERRRRQVRQWADDLRTRGDVVETTRRP